MSNGRYVMAVSPNGVLHVMGVRRCPVISPPERLVRVSRKGFGACFRVPRDM